MNRDNLQEFETCFIIIIILETNPKTVHFLEQFELLA